MQNSSEHLNAERLIASVLRHDRKQNSYKLALIRALNDAALAYPDVGSLGGDVAVPLRVLAASWIAYYWPFADLEAPILQGQRRSGAGGRKVQDLEFRPALHSLRQLWERAIGTRSRPSDGYILAGEMALDRRRDKHPAELILAFQAAVRAAQATLEQPIRYAGPGEWQVFPRPRPLREIQGSVTAVPGAEARDRCVVVPGPIWRSLAERSLWVEALTIHQWALYTETVPQDGRPPVSRGEAYTLLTDHPESRRPLTWERNHVDLLLLEGKVFHCPWTGHSIARPGSYDLDHLVPLAVYPMNDLWNLVPADPKFNSTRKRDRLPTDEALTRAIPHLRTAYQLYQAAPELSSALRRDVLGRFARIDPARIHDPQEVTRAVAAFITQVAETRSVARFDVS